MYFKSFTKTAKPSGMSRVIIFDIPNLKNWDRANLIFAVSFYGIRHIRSPAAMK
jgi:hypothetical protein